MQLGRVSAPLFGLAVVAATPAAKAAPTTAARAVQLHYAAPVGCPGALTFSSQVQARTTRLGFVEQSSLQIEVQIESVGSGFAGRVVAPWLEGAGDRLAATTCDEVVAGLALGVALLVDAEAARAPEIVVRPAPAARPPSPKRRRPPPARRWQWALDAGARSGLIRPLSPLVGSTFSWVGDPNSVSWLPDLHLTLQGIAGGQVVKPGLETRLSALVALLDVCPLRVRLGGSLSGCVAGETGVLLARVDPGRDVKSALFLVGPAARYQLPLGGFFLGWRAAATLSAVRQDYFYRPEARAYRTPAVVFQCGAYVGYSFE